MRERATKSLKLSKLNFAIPLMAISGLAALGVGFINYDPEDFASASNDSTIKSTISYSDEYITISNNSVIDLGSSEVTVDSSYVYATDNVTVSTNVPTGYDLYLSSSSNESASLKNPDSYTEIAATSGTGGSGGTPKALDPDSYGYAVSSSLIGNTSFDADYSSPTSTSKWAGIPTGTSDRIHSASAATPDGDTTAVHYGANLTNYLAPGEYTGKVTYSAVVTPADNDIEMSVSPNSGMAGTILTITSGPKDTISTSHSLQSDDVDIIFSQNGEAKGHCGIDSIDTSAGYLATTCYAPDLATGTYDLEIIVSRYSFKDKIHNGYMSTTYSDGVTPLNITMQNMNSSICSGLVAFDSSKAMATTYAITDARDNNPYLIRKLADNHCWMISNLRLGNTNSTISLTPNDSDVISAWDLPASTSGEWSNPYREAHIYINSTNGTNWGNYYNWTAATAGLGTITPTSGNVGISICPKGWKLPLGDTSTYSWYYLAQRYGFTGSNYSDNTFMSDFQTATNTGSDYWAGIYNNSPIDTGSYIHLWSRTAYNNNNAYELYVGSDAVKPRNYDLKGYGRSVRCVFVGE